MNVQIFGAVLASTPALSFWLSWPRRRWVVWSVAAAALVFWLVGFVVVAEADRVLWFGVGAWGLLGGLYACYVVSRNDGEYLKFEAVLRERSGWKASLEKSVAEAKAKGLKTEGEQKEVQALYGMIKGLSEALSWDEVRPRLELSVQQYLGLEEFALYVADLRAQNEIHPLVVRKLSMSVGASWDTLARCFQERNIPMTVPTLLESPELAVAVPIQDANELMGYFYARVPAGADAKALLEKVVSFVDQISFAFRRVKLFQELERLSMIDGLTGVHRRGIFDTRIKEEVVRAKTFKTTFCLLLLDIDHFKKLNDTYGHPFGDQVLRRVGEILKSSVYETDFVARYGGEEFAVLLPRAEAAGVIRKAQTIRAAVEQEAFQLAMETVRITVSIGVAHYPRDGAAAEVLVHQADQALYHAKESGRNCVVDILEVPGKRIHGRN